MLKGIKRNAIRKDLFSFLIPWITIMYLAMAVSLWEFAWVRNSQITLSALFITGIILILIIRFLPSGIWGKIREIRIIKQISGRIT